MSCVACNKLTQHGANYCNACFTFQFCSLCHYHNEQVGPLRSRHGENCCEDCLQKAEILVELEKENVEMETISVIAENPTYLTDLVNGWWSDGSRYYFAIQNQIYSAPDIPMDYNDFKRAILFDTIDAEMCGVIRGTTVIWS